MVTMRKILAASLGLSYVNANDRYVQRLSVYIQIKDNLPRTPSELDMKDPYAFVKKVKKELSSNGNVKTNHTSEKRDDNNAFDNGKVSEATHTVKQD